MATQSKPDAPWRVLIVEDEIAVAMHLEDLLLENGYDVVGIARNIEQALKCLDDCDPDGALLDLDLHGKRSTAVAEKLREKGIPFVLETAQGPEALTDAPFREAAALVQKPWKEQDVLHGLSGILQNRPVCETAHSANVFSFPAANRALSQAGEKTVERPDLLKADYVSGPARRLLPIKHDRISTPYYANSGRHSPGLPGTCAEHMDVHAIHGEAAELPLQPRPHVVPKGSRATPGICGGRRDIGLKQV